MTTPAVEAKFRTKVAEGVYRRRTKAGKNRYDAAYVDGTGRQRWSSFESKADAVAFRAKMVGTPRVERAAPERRVFAAVAEEWLEQRSSSGKRPLRPRTAKLYRDALDLVLLPRFGRWRLGEIDADAVARLIRDLQSEGLHAFDPSRPRRPLGRSSVENYCKPLQGVLALALRRRWIATNPFSVLTAEDRATDDEDESRPYEWSDADLAALYAGAERVAAKERSRQDYSLLLRVAGTLGLRLGEVLGLCWRDFDREARVLRVERQWLRPVGRVGAVRYLPARYGPPKTVAGRRSVPLPDDLRDRLLAAKLASRHSLDGDPVFASRTGGPLSHRNVTRRGFEAARDQAGLEASLTFHDLRHAAISRLIAQGVPDVAIAEVVGHTNPEMIRRVYGHVFERERSDEQVRRALAAEV